MFNNQKLIRRTVVGSILVLVFIVVWYVYSHGFIKIEDGNEKQTVSYVHYDKKLGTTFTDFMGSQKLVASGDYSVVRHSSNGSVSFSDIIVPHFLSSVTVKNSGDEPLLIPIARKVTEAIALKNGALTGYTPEGVLKTFNSDNISGDGVVEFQDKNFPTLEKMVQINASVVGGVIQTDDGYQPVIYNLSTSTISYFPSIAAQQGGVFIRPVSNGFSSYSLQTGNVVVYKVGTKDPTTSFSLQSTKDISKYDGQPLYSFEKDTVALVIGKDTVSGGDAENPEGDTNLTLFIRNIKDVDKKMEVPLGEGGVSDISLSPDASHIYIQNSQSSVIFNTTTGQVEFRIPYPVGQFMWTKKDGDFVFVTMDSGIFKGSVEKNIAMNIVSYTAVRPTRISFIEGGSVYFTGYTTKTDGNEDPDAYQVDLEKPSTSDSRSRLQNFPHQGENFYIDYLGNMLTVQLTRYITDTGASEADGARAAAIQYIRSRISNPQNYTVRYIFVDIDLRATTGGDSGDPDYFEEPE